MRRVLRRPMILFGLTACTLAALFGVPACGGNTSLGTESADTGSDAGQPCARCTTDGGAPPLCTDGTPRTSTCVSTNQGACVLQWSECPPTKPLPDAGCAKEECGPLTAQDTMLCLDGSETTFQCTRVSETCTWTMTTCPENVPVDTRSLRGFTPQKLGGATSVVCNEGQESYDLDLQTLAIAWERCVFDGLGALTLVKGTQPISALDAQAVKSSFGKLARVLGQSICEAPSQVYRVTIASQANSATYVDACNDSTPTSHVSGVLEAFSTLRALVP